MAELTTLESKLGEEIGRCFTRAARARELALPVELCSPWLLVSRAMARRRASGFGRGSGHRASPATIHR